MKIMLVNFLKVVNSAGGAERVFCNMSNEFVRRGYEVYAVCCDWEDGTPFYELDGRVNFINIDEAFDMHAQFSEEFSKETTEMLACLKPRDRELFLKLYVEEKSFDEISQETGTEKTVLYNRLSRSKRKIRRLFPRNRQNHNTNTVPSSFSKHML